MTPEIYQAMKRRIQAIYPDGDQYRYAEILASYKEKGWSVSEGCPFYFFNADGLNEGLSDFDIDYVDSVIQPINTHNLWNVCQRFYSFIKGYNNIDKRLLNA